MSNDKNVFTQHIANDRDYRDYKDYSSCNQGPILYNIILNAVLKMTDFIVDIVQTIEVKEKVIDAKVILMGFSNRFLC